MSTGIQWTDETWNPITGCTRVSPGCENCYAEALSATRLSTSPKYQGVATRTAAGPRWTGRIRLHPEVLDRPVRWTKPRRIFVNSMSDTFHADVPEEFLDALFAAMAVSPEHVFQVLTKRPHRAAEYLASPGRAGSVAAETARGTDYPHDPPWPFVRPDDLAARWPLPNVWIGTSIEDQERADARIPHLLRCPAAVRFLSCEPLLGEVRLRALGDSSFDAEGAPHYDALGGFSYWGNGDYGVDGPSVDWVIVGGESGPEARPMYLDWARRIVEDCRSAGVAVFVKQLGANPVGDARLAGTILDSKGGRPDEWPEDLRVREWPPTTEATAPGELPLTD